MTEDEMVRWHHRLNGHEFEQTLGDTERLGSLACCGPWGRGVGQDLATEQFQPRPCHTLGSCGRQAPPRGQNGECPARSGGHRGGR